MALEGTHIKFALELKEIFNIKDEAEYLSGATYPDSRYFSKIDRGLTHPKDFLENPFFFEKDFNKGWFTHLLLDQVQYLAMSELFSEKIGGIITKNNDVWYARTALKIIEDLFDVKDFDISFYLNKLSSREAPNGESFDQLSRYYDSIKNLYSEPNSIGFDNYMEFFKQPIGNKEQIKRLMTKISDYSSDTSTMSKIKQVYSVSLNKAMELIKKEV